MARGDEAEGTARRGAAPGATASRWAQRFRLPIAAVVLVVWLLITALTPSDSGFSGNFIEALAQRPQWGILAAAVFLLVVVAACRWGDIGINAPVPMRSLRLLWLPGLYLLLFVLADIGVVLAYGPPPAGVAAFLLLNALFAGVSEELMFRGVLFGALRTRLRPVLAILITTLLFGGAHLLNAAVIGSWRVAGAQAVAASMSGLVFIAMRVRTGSLLPAIVYHAAWDFGSLFAVSRLLMAEGGAASAGGGIGGGGVEGATVPMLLAPVLLLLPNFLYALYLLRPRKASLPAA